MTIDRRTLLLSVAALAACGPMGAEKEPPAKAEEEDPRPREYELLNQAAPDFSLPKLGGGMASLTDYTGRVVILYFGGLWCPDCIVDGANTSALAALAERDRDVDFLNIHTRNRFGRWGPNDRDRATGYDVSESEVALNAYFTETGHSYPVAFDATRNWAHDVYKIEWSPSFVVVDRNGVIRAWRTDLLDAATTQAFFDEAKRIATSA